MGSKPANMLQQIAAFCLILCLHLHHGNTKTIKETIDDTSVLPGRDLSRLKRYLENLQIWVELGLSTSRGYTFFASHDMVFITPPLPRKVLDDLQQLAQSSTSRNTYNDIFLRHLVISKSSTSELETKQVLRSAGGLKLFVQKLDNDIFVNGALILTPNINLDNGMMHIVDGLFYHTYSTKNAKEWIDENIQSTNEIQNTQIFSNLIDSYKRLGLGEASLELSNSLEPYDRYHTVFVPYDIYFDTVNNYERELTDNTELFKKVIESHIILGEQSDSAAEVYHLKVLEKIAESSQNQRSALYGTIQINKYKDEVYVSNNCAQGKIIMPDITVGNAVIHIIDGMMGWVYYDMYSLMEVEPVLDKFEGNVKSTGGFKDELRVPQGSSPASDEIYTLFAPINDAFSSNIDITQTSDLETTLRKHMLKEKLFVREMVNGTRKETRVPGVFANFYTEGDTTIVEIDHVRGRITKADLCVKNGIVHYVDTVLGVAPYTIIQYIEREDPLIQFYSLVRRTPSASIFGQEGKITVFATLNAGIIAMQNSDIGRKYLGSSVALSALIKRHEVPGELYLDSMDGNQMSVETNAGVNLEIHKKNQGGYYILYKVKDSELLPVEINIITANLKMQNGVIHIIDKMIYDETSLDYALTQGAATYTLSTAVLLLGALFAHKIL